MPDTAPTPRIIRFGIFEAHLAAGELRKDGVKVKLQERPFQVLTILLERAGEIVSRDFLRQKVWPDTFVDFDHSLNSSINKLRYALGDDADNPRFIATVGRRGYRFIAPAGEVGGAAASAVVRNAGSDVVHRAQSWRSVTEAFTRGGGIPARIGTILAAAAVITLALFSYRAIMRKVMPIRAPARARTIAILPFRNLRPDPETDFLGFSLADTIINQLGHVGAVSVRPSAYVANYRNQEIDAKKVAKDLNVNTLLIGSFLKEGGNLRVTAQLIDMTADEVLWFDTLDVKYEKLLTVQDRIAEEIIRGLRLSLTPTELGNLKHDLPSDPLAYEYYLRGVEKYFSEDFPIAIEMLQSSVSTNPNYARAWAYLGIAYTVNASLRFGGRQQYAKAQAAFEKALALDPAQLDARTWMASLLTDTNRVELAVPLLSEVLKSNPNYAPAHWELSYAYRYAGMLDESIQEGERARQLDPKSKLASATFNSYFYTGQYEKFVASLPQDEETAFVIFYRGLGAYYMKDWARAAADFDRAYQLDPSLLHARIGKSLSYFIADQNPRGLRLLRETERRIEEHGVSDAEAIYKVAQAYAVLGDASSALRVLQRSIEKGFFPHRYLVNDPLLGNVRSNPQYASLMEMARSRHELFKRSFF